ncbi:hypothetical protein LBMAG42_12860 [Deltaproteobacteria bacterium]|nr:hypothetical protein LBMAG42_12860 [Deltaproteobacteria bacterium]
MRGLSLGIVTVLLLSCTNCCCLRIPTFGFWPEVDEAELVARVRDSPIVVDHLCAQGEECVAVESATVNVYPLAWGPIFGDVTVLLEVEATCRPIESARERYEPVACAGMLMALYENAPDGLKLMHVTENTIFGVEPSGLTYEQSLSSGGGGDWD